MDKKILCYLRGLAENDVRYDMDDFSPYDAFGGNMDDAYWVGIDDGRADLARELLGLLTEEE